MKVELAEVAVTGDLGDGVVPVRHFEPGQGWGDWVGAECWGGV